MEPNLGVIKQLPLIEKVNGRWVIDGFTGAPAAWDYKKYKGKRGTLYVVECAGVMKIGMTSLKVDIRLRAIDTHCPLPLRKVLIQRIPLAGLAYAESYLHDLFKDKWVKGEWFAVTDDEVKAAMPGALARAKVYDAACWQQWQEDEYGRRCEFRKLIADRHSAQTT